METSQDLARSPSILRLSCGPVNASSVEYCGATGCTIANVVVAWQSVVGGSATTAKLSVPPRLGCLPLIARPPISEQSRGVKHARRWTRYSSHFLPESCKHGSRLEACQRVFVHW